MSPVAVLEAKIREVVNEELRSDLNPAMVAAKTIAEQVAQETIAYVDGQIAQLGQVISDNMAYLAGMVAGAKISMENPTGEDRPAIPTKK